MTDELEFAPGDRVRFKGDDVVYEICCTNDEDGGTYELHHPELEYRAPDYVPGRLLEAAPSLFEDGDVVMDGLGGFTITDGRYFYDELSSWKEKSDFWSDRYSREDLPEPLTRIGHVNREGDK